MGNDPRLLTLREARHGPIVFRCSDLDTALQLAALGERVESVMSVSRDITVQNPVFVLK